jgi:hypothetical protein
MNVHCYCGRGYEIPRKVKKELLVGFDAFCGEECLYQLLVDEGLRNKQWPEMESSVMDPPTEFWCKETRRYFRSRLEAAFARWCEANAIKWEYEAYTIRLKDNQTYTPDFWLPDYSHLAEVKGVWGGSAKKKLRLAKALGFLIVLVPTHLVYKLTRTSIK